VAAQLVVSQEGPSSTKLGCIVVYITPFVEVCDRATNSLRTFFKKGLEFRIFKTPFTMSDFFLKINIRFVVQFIPQWAG
jgi:hypothetical protein